MSEIRKVSKDQREVSTGDATGGIVRETAVSGEGIWLGLVRAAPSGPSGWHHHGDYDTYFYVERGKMRMEYGPGGSRSVEAVPGDFVHVPKAVVHREFNPTEEEVTVILVRVGSGPPVVNVDGPDPS